ncbi:hypothetical protein OE88DRAFT_1736379 [Heliocybe sulcata]|uniref:Lytic polysaccharide monooxygenase n=1 Tax=Heliocybe sulcata TaxID=5364 RepID=A0A5C3MY38_9AGAM|nr:hypothetical protein OE88DRAFT_1736379 [Heliocybe sulcata]
MSRGVSFSLFFVSLAGLAAGHAAIWHPSMWGFNVTQQSYAYDNRPVTPLMAMSFEQWWFHGHLDHPPHPEDVYQLPAGKPATFEVACSKSATSYFASSGGGNVQSGNDPCPGGPPSAYHTTGIDDVKGCSLAIAYKSDVSQVQPEDFTVFSVNHTCVWNRFTDFQVPERMPSCPPGGCICAFFWIHSADSGSEQNYMNGFQCNVTGSTSNIALATPKLARRCGADPANGRHEASTGNCTYGAKQPFYWFQKEKNNMFEGTYSPPFYNDLYNFKDGAQDDIFQDSYVSMPPPSPNAALPVLNANVGRTNPSVTTSGASSAPSATATATSSKVSSVISTAGSGSSSPSPIIPASASVSLPTTSTSISSHTTISASASVPAFSSPFTTIHLNPTSSSSAERITLSLSSASASASQIAPPNQLAQSGSTASPPAPSSSRVCKSRPGGKLRKRSNSRFLTSHARHGRLTKRDLWVPFS